MIRVDRQIKKTSEAYKIKKACKLGDEIFSQTLKKIEVGISEKELALEIIRLIRSHNARLSFRPIVAFGKNASEVHHKPMEVRLKKNHGFIMIDLGVKLDGYCSDMTRTIFIGKASLRQKKIYQTVLESQKKSIDYINSSIKSGKSISAKKIDQTARDYITEKGFPSIPHSVGHGIGRKVHEAPKISPKSKSIMKSGMVFTIEPGIYIKGLGGVRIEDTFYLKNGRLKSLTESNRSLMEL